MLSICTHSIYEGPRLLGLNPGEYVYAGSVPLEAHGIRTSRDRDMIVSDAAWGRLMERYGASAILSDRRMVIPFSNGIEYDITNNWINWGKGCSNRIIETAENVNGICIANLGTVKAYKKVLGRPKDEVDIELMNRVLH